MTRYAVTLTMKTYMAFFPDEVLAYPHNKPYTATVVIEAGSERAARSQAFDLYMNYPGAIGQIDQVKEL